jgi:hypothetical protein
MLERVAVHQTRLRTPGLGLDPKGIALGAKGLVLLPSIDRLVAFLSLYTKSASLEDILRTLRVEVVKSKLGAREVTLTFNADGCDRMDRIAEVARLAGGSTLTGTSRHFVQYRDAAAPFGYDVGEIQPGDAALMLYHSNFSQAYGVERVVEVRSLVLRLEPHVDPTTAAEPGAKWISAEQGLGPALIGYFVRSGVDADVGIAEWPPSSSFDDGPVRRYVFKVNEIPQRMLPLLTRTPGLHVYNPTGEGVAVEVGFRHPINLRACPVFPASGLVLFRGRGEEPLELPRLPALGAVRAFARVNLADEAHGRITAVSTGAPPTISLALRLLPSTDPWRGVTATWVHNDELPLLRRIAYVLGPDTLKKTTVAFTSAGAFVRNPAGIETIPVGEFFREVHPGLFVVAGYDPLPAVSPEVLYKSLGAPSGQVLFVGRDERIVGVPGAAFVSLETALLEGQSWAPLPAEALESALATEVPELMLDSPGFRPMRDVGAVEAPPPALPAPTPEGTG